MKSLTMYSGVVSSIRGLNTLMEDNVSCSPSLRRFKPEALSVKASGDSVLNISEYINYYLET